MNTRELAEKLDGNLIGEEISLKEAREAKNNNLVVVFGSSDDLMEFRGAIYGEVYSYGDGVAYLNENGLIENKCDEANCPYFNEIIKSAITIKALWCHTDGPCWTYKTKISHETFDIFEEGEPYCKGIVFLMGDIK